jgi:hypothetical protein
MRAYTDGFLFSQHIQAAWLEVARLRLQPHRNAACFSGTTTHS